MKPYLLQHLANFYFFSKVYNNNNNSHLPIIFHTSHIKFVHYFYFIFYYYFNIRQFNNFYYIYEQAILTFFLLFRSLNTSVLSIVYVLVLLNFFSVHFTYIHNIFSSSVVLLSICIIIVQKSERVKKKIKDIRKS